MIKTTLLLTLCVAVATTTYVTGQAPVVTVASATTTSNDKIAALSPWIGHWKGESLSRMGPGEMKRSTVDERIESRLEGAILLIEGIGKATDAKTNQETIVHHALAVLSYDQAEQKYKFRSYLDNGRSTDAWFNVISSTQYQWGFDTPRGKMRYNITIDPAKKTWTETGEFSSDDKTWNKFIDMTLTRVD